MAGNAGSHRNMSFQRSQRIICGGPNNLALDIEISEEGYFYVGNRPRQFSGRESDGQRFFLCTATAGGLGCVWRVA
jgi:hypothetical protein